MLLAMDFAVQDSCSRAPVVFFFRACVCVCVDSPCLSIERDCDDGRELRRSACLSLIELLLSTYL